MASPRLPPVDYQTHPDRYKHYTVTYDGPVATLRMDIDEDAGIRPGYKLKLNSYDLARPCFSMQCIIDKQNRTCYTQQIGPSKAMSYPMALKKLHVSRGNT